MYKANTSISAYSINSTGLINWADNSIPLCDNSIKTTNHSKVNMTNYAYSTIPNLITTALIHTILKNNNQSLLVNITSNGTDIDCITPTMESVTRRKVKLWRGVPAACKPMFVFQFVMYVHVMGFLEIVGFILNILSFLIMWPDR